MSQTDIIKVAINSILDQGETDKRILYNKVVEMTGLPRHTIRRVAREMLAEFKRRCEILKPFGCEDGNFESR